MSGIAMLVNEYPPQPVGGAERQAERLAGYLARRGWPVFVITRRASDLRAQETVNGVRIIRPVTFGPGKIRTITFIIGTLLELCIRRKEYDLLHAHLAFGPAFAAVIAGHLLGKKVIVKLGNSGEFGDLSLSQRTLRGQVRLSVLKRWADRIIVLDEKMQSEALAVGFDAHRIVRMNNGIDASHFGCPPAEVKKNERVNILYVGRLTAQKSISTLLNALALAVPACPQLYLTLVGQGELRQTLEAETAQLGLSQYVTFAGDQSDVRPFLGRGEIFALPSLAEGISNALLEAMSAGLACLATPVGGNVEVLAGGGCGILLPQDDIQAWSAALIRLGRDPEERARLGWAARQRIMDAYDFSMVGKQYEELYSHLISGQTHAAQA